MLLLLLLISSVWGETVFDAATVARNVLNTGSDGALATTYRYQGPTIYRDILGRIDQQYDNDFTIQGETYSISFPYVTYERYAQSYLADDNLIFLLENTSITARNLEINSHGSFTVHISAWHWYFGQVNYPAALPKITFMGTFLKQTDKIDRENNLNHFLIIHPTMPMYHLDHYDVWAFQIKKIHYVGSDDDASYSGWIDLDAYFLAR